jgi:hypothetical protein
MVSLSSLSLNLSLSLQHWDTVTSSPRSKTKYVLACHETREIHELFPALSAEEILVDVEQRLGKHEGLARGIAAKVDIEHCLEEGLRFLLVVLVCLAGVHAAGTDRWRVGEVARDVVVEVEVGEHHLAAPSARKLVELEDEHLGELLKLRFGLVHEEGREEHVHRFPPDRARVVRLQSARHLDHMSDEHLGVLCGPAHAGDVGEIEAELLDVLEAMASAVRPDDEPEVV